jgi:hypothetical protein
MGNGLLQDVEMTTKHIHTHSTLLTVGQVLNGRHESGVLESRGGSAKTLEVP